MPAIVSAPALGLRAGRNDALVAALDLAPTFVELAGGTNDTTVGGREVLPMTGRSFAALLRGEIEATRGPDETLALRSWPTRRVPRRLEGTVDRAAERDRGLATLQPRRGSRRNHRCRGGASGAYGRARRSVGPPRRAGGVVPPGPPPGATRSAE